MWKSITKYSFSVLKQWWIIAISIFFAGFQIIPYFGRGSTIIPNWLAITLVIFAIIIAQFRVFHKLEGLIIVANQIEEVLTKLTDLRSGGVDLRNRGMRLRKKEEIDAWILDIETWNLRVKSIINELSPPEAGLYGTLDWVDFPIEPFAHLIKDFSPDQLQTLRIHSQRLRSVRELVVRYTQLVVDRRSRI